MNLDGQLVLVFEGNVLPQTGKSYGQFNQQDIYREACCVLPASLAGVSGQLASSWMNQRTYSAGFR
jgi:hypothetical protein